MRVISMVPSWTETLLRVNIDVVGRTKFCVHPADRVASIPVVGGTKKVNWDRVRELAPDLLVLDQEENPRSIADRSPVPYHATHVRAASDVAGELAALAARLDGDPGLLAFAERWRYYTMGPPPQSRPPTELPGVIEWIRRPTEQHDRFVYLIWRDPWMAVGPSTFIGSMFARLGFGAAHGELPGKYPAVDLAQFDRRRTVLLFSTEPYPFARYRDVMVELADSGFSAALVDGEAYSWFGVRSLQFLEQELARVSAPRPPS